MTVCGMQVRGLVDSFRVPGKWQRVMSLQLEAFWLQHRRNLIAVGGVGVIYVLW